MRRATAINLALVVACALLPGACGLANQRHFISWQANLDKLPDPVCVRNTINSIPMISHVRDESTGTKRQVLGLYLTPDDIYPEMRVIVAGPPDRLFQIVYGDYDRLRSEREQVARSVINSIAKTCDVPELSQRARERHDAEWRPYFFNI